MNSPHGRVKSSTRSCGVLHTLVSSSPHVRVKHSTRPCGVRADWTNFSLWTFGCWIVRKKSNEILISSFFFTFSPLFQRALSYFSEVFCHYRFLKSLNLNLLTVFCRQSYGFFPYRLNKKQSVIFIFGNFLLLLSERTCLLFPS